ITATERQNVLLAPNTALRFTPAQPGQKPQAQGGGGNNIVGSLMPRMPRGTSQRRTGNGTDGTGAAPKQLWVLQDGKPMPLRVTTGISDGRMTEVSGEGLQEGLQVITEQRAATK
ncbi:MAG TPA: efflux RND transporter periplasmic adaptor subunit, partial [Rhizobacter sp.]